MITAMELKPTAGELQTLIITGVCTLTIFELTTPPLFCFNLAPGHYFWSGLAELEA